MLGESRRHRPLIQRGRPKRHHSDRCSAAREQRHCDPSLSQRVSTEPLKWPQLCDGRGSLSSRATRDAAQPHSSVAMINAMSRPFIKSFSCSHGARALAILRPDRAGGYSNHRLAAAARILLSSCVEPAGPPSLAGRRLCLFGTTQIKHHENPGHDEERTDPFQ